MNYNILTVLMQMALLQIQFASWFDLNSGASKLKKVTIDKFTLASGSGTDTNASTIMNGAMLQQGMPSLLDVYSHNGVTCDLTLLQGASSFIHDLYADTPHIMDLAAL